MENMAKRTIGAVFGRMDKYDQKLYPTAIILLYITSWEPKRGRKMKNQAYPQRMLDLKETHDILRTL